VRVLRWTYASERLVLYFQDQTGFSRFRLAPASRAEYQRGVDANEARPTVRHHRAIWIAALAGDLCLASSSRAQTAAPPRATRRIRCACPAVLAMPPRRSSPPRGATPNPNAFLIVEARQAKSMQAYEHARTLLAAQPWLLDYLDGEALALLGRRSMASAISPTATHFEMAARPRAGRARARCWPSGAGLAFDAAGQADSAAAAFARSPRRGGKLASIDTGYACDRPASRGIRQSANQLLADLAAPAARDAPVARGALVAAGWRYHACARRFCRGREGGKSRRRASGSRDGGDSARSRTMLYGLLARDPLSDDAAAGVSLALGPFAPARRRRACRDGARVESSQLAARCPDPPGARAAQRRFECRHASSLWRASRVVGTDAGRRACLRPAGARDSAARPLAIYRRARVLVRLGDSTAIPALADSPRAIRRQCRPGSALHPGRHAGRPERLGQAGRWYGS